MPRPTPSTAAKRSVPSTSAPASPPDLAAIVKIGILRNGKPKIVVTPKVVEAYYLHRGNPQKGKMHPHSIVWRIDGLEEDERIEVRLHCGGVKAKGNEIDEDEGQSLLTRLLPTSLPMEQRAKGTSTSRGWTARQGPSASLDTGELRLPSDEHGPINVKYSIRLLAGQDELAYLDPGVDLIPDP